MGLPQKVVRSFLIPALLLQLPQLSDRELDRERDTARGQRPWVAMVRIRAVHADGSPARGSISCSGYWRKFDETEQGGWGIPFETDSTGSIIMNPWLGDYEDDLLVCSALDQHSHTGSVGFNMPTSYVEITVS